MQLLAARHADRIRLRVARPLKDGTAHIVMSMEERTRPTIVRTPEGEHYSNYRRFHTTARIR